MEGFAASCEPKGGRNKDKRFHVLIIEIANFFKLYLPNSAISKYPNTHFSRVVTYILTDVLDERYSEYKGPKDPERRIEDSLKEFHARVNWKGQNKVFFLGFAFYSFRIDWLA